MKGRSWTYYFIYDNPPQSFSGVSGGYSEAFASMIFRSASGWFRNFSDRLEFASERVLRRGAGIYAYMMEFSNLGGHGGLYFTQ